LVLVLLTIVVVVGTFVPGVFHDTYASEGVTLRRNRLTGDVLVVDAGTAGVWSCLHFGSSSHDTLFGTPSVFGD